jgi:hypothetical protein
MIIESVFEKKDKGGIYYATDNAKNDNEFPEINFNSKIIITIYQVKKKDKAKHHPYQ